MSRPASNLHANRLNAVGKIYVDPNVTPPQQNNMGTRNMRSRDMGARGNGSLKLNSNKVLPAHNPYATQRTAANSSKARRELRKKIGKPTMGNRLRDMVGMGKKKTTRKTSASKSVRCSAKTSSGSRCKHMTSRGKKCGHHRK